MGTGGAYFAVRESFDAVKKGNKRTSRLGALVLTYGVCCMLTGLWWPGTIVGVGILLALNAASLYHDRLNQSRGWLLRAWGLVFLFVALFAAGHVTAWAAIRNAQPTVEEIVADMSADFRYGPTIESMPTQEERDRLRLGYTYHAELKASEQPNQARYTASMLAMGFATGMFQLGLWRLRRWQG